MSKIFKLVSENMTHLGGPMGTEYTYPNWTRYFSSVEKAKAYALKDYRKETANKKANLMWLKDGKGVRTEDLSFVMYLIHPVELTE